MSVSITDPYIDGWIGAEGRELTKAPVRKYPFKTNPIRPDFWTREYERDFEVLPIGYTTRVAVRTAWTNLITNSEDFTAAAWTKTNATATANIGTAPDGNATLGKLLESSATGEHSVSQAATVTAAETEVSVFAQGGLTRRVIRVAFTDSAAATFYADFDIEGGTALARSSGVTAIITPMGLSQFYCVIRFTPAAGAGTFKVNVSSTPGTISYAGNTALGVYLWGAQVATGAKAPYVSTTALTRTALTPDRDPSDPMAYLIFETDMNVVNAASATVRRTFSRIPIQQIEPGSRFISKPELPGEFPQDNGTAIIVQPEENIPRWYFYSRLPITGDTGVPGVEFEGGSFTLQFGANTTGLISTEATAGAVAAALNALPSIAAKGGVTVSGDFSSGFLVTFAAIPIATVNAGGITVASGSPNGWINEAGFTHHYTQQVIIDSTTGGDITGGTFTITILGQTTASIAYNANASTAVAAINALSNVAARGGVTRDTSAPDGTILSAPNRIIFNFNFPPNDPIAVGTTLLLPPGSSGSVSYPPTVPGSNFYWHVGQLISFTAGTGTRRTFEVVGHGLTLTDPIVIKIGSTFYTLAAGSFTIPDADHIQITTTAGAALTDEGIATILGKNSGSAYTGGNKLARVKRITDFYVLGVTPGITTSDDIPIPLYQGDDTSLLAAIFAGLDDINYEVNELEEYKDGPILQRTRTTIDPSQL